MAIKNANVLFKYGVYLALTPSFSSPVLTKCQKLYFAIFLTFVVSLTLMSNYLRMFIFRLYDDFIYAKIVVCVVLDLDILAFNIYTTLCVVWWKKNQWANLIIRIKCILKKTNCLKKYDKLVNFVIGRIVINFILLICIDYYWITVYGFWNYFPLFNVYYLQLFLFSVFHVVLSFILSLLLAQYTFLNQNLEENIKKYKSCLYKFYSISLLNIDKLELELYFLKDTMDIVDDIFGWPLFFIIIFTTLYMLNNLDFIFEDANLGIDDIGNRIFAEGLLLLIIFVRFYKNC